MSKINYESIGILGGSFDPPHIGHLKISKISLKKLKLKTCYWVVTKKNPFKDEPYYSINSRVKKCRSISNKINKIKVKYLDKKIKSTKTINVIKYFKKKNKNIKLYLILGADNLINFHLWLNWKKIVKLAELVVFSRKGFDKKAKNSVIMNHLKNKKIIFINNKKIDISSTIIKNKKSRKLN